MSRITVEQLKEMYIKNARNLYFREMDIRRRTEIHRVSVVLEMTELEVEVIWNEDLAP